MKTVKCGLLAAVLATGLLGASCLGPNKAFNKLNDWNSKVTENKWANEAVFLVLNIIPVYGFAYLADIVVFNSLEFWGAKNPMD